MKRELHLIKLLLLMAIAFVISKNLKAQFTAPNTTRLIPAGSVVIDMGIEPQTADNTLLAYGLVYRLVIDEKAPVIWSINPNKAKDGIDFTVDGRDFRGGTFIIEKDFAELPSVQALLNNPSVDVYEDADKNGIRKSIAKVNFTTLVKYTTQTDVEIAFYKEMRSFTN